MSWHAVCVAAALWLCAVRREALSVASNSSCVETFQCFDAEYPECVNDTTVTDQPIQGTVRDMLCYNLANSIYTCTVSIGSRQGSLLNADDFSELLTELVCHHLNRSTTPFLCWVFSQSMNVTSECNRYVHHIPFLY